MKKVLINLLIGISVFGVSCSKEVKAPVEDKVVEVTENQVEDKVVEAPVIETREEKIDSVTDDLYQVLVDNFTDSVIEVKHTKEGNIDVITFNVRFNDLLTEFSQMVESGDFSKYDLMLTSFETMNSKMQEYADTQADNVLVFVELTDLDTDFPFFSICNGKACWSVKDEYLKGNI